MSLLDGNVAVVTGASSGIGAATLALLESSGAIGVNWDVAAPSDPARGFMQVDVADSAAVAAAAGEVERTFGGIDILVNVAGNGSQQTVEAMSTEDWKIGRAHV